MPEVVRIKGFSGDAIWALVLEESRVQIWDFMFRVRGSYRGLWSRAMIGTEWVFRSSSGVSMEEASSNNAEGSLPDGRQRPREGSCLHVLGLLETPAPSCVVASVYPQDP